MHNEFRQKALADLWNSIKDTHPNIDNLPYFIYFAYILAEEDVEKQARQALKQHPLGDKIHKQFLRGVDANIFLRALKANLRLDIAPILELILRYGHFLYDSQFWFTFSSFLNIPLASLPSTFNLSRIAVDLSLEES
jgi:hypothetical protein